MIALEARDFIAMLALYIAIYYWLARSAFSQLRVIDPDRYSKLGGRQGIGMTNSMGVLRMLLDQELPKQSYPVGVGRKINGARRMLMALPFACLGAVVLAKAIDYLR